MMNLTHSTIVSSGLRGLVCASLSTLIVAVFSWSFVASTNSVNWMAGNGLNAPEMAMLLEDNIV